MFLLVWDHIWEYPDCFFEAALPPFQIEIFLIIHVIRAISSKSGFVIEEIKLVEEFKNVMLFLKLFEEKVFISFFLVQSQIANSSDDIDTGAIVFLVKRDLKSLQKVQMDVFSKDLLVKFYFV